MYKGFYSDEFIKKLSKLKKGDNPHYSRVRKKIDMILATPDHSYKYLEHRLKGVNRVHIGHFVLVFVINHPSRMISFEDYDHHDNIYHK